MSNELKAENAELKRDLKTMLKLEEKATELGSPTEPDGCCSYCDSELGKGHDKSCPWEKFTAKADKLRKKYN